MKRDMSRRRVDAVAPDHLSVARPLRPEDLDRQVTHHVIYLSLPASPDVSTVSTSSHPIIGESATVFTDMTDTMLKVLDR